ncbi:MAG: DUF481 domain-containing protein, partial [Gammaproteobacteria bacterium]
AYSIASLSIMIAAGQLCHEVELSSGRRVYGELRAPQNAKTLNVAAGTLEQFVSILDVVRMEPIEESFLTRLDGSLDVGYSFTQSSGVTQINLGTQLNYRTRKAETNLNFAGIVTTQSDGDDTRRWSVDTMHRRFAPNRWFTSYYNTLEGNEELGIDLRALFGAGRGRYLMQTNRAQVSIAAGFAVTREQTKGGADDQTNLEGLLTADASLFRYDTPKTDITTRLSIFPSVTDTGRVRSILDIQLRRELIEDFFWALTFFDTYDSRPPTDASENDYGIVTSLGYTF